MIVKNASMNGMSNGHLLKASIWLTKTPKRLNQRFGKHAKKLIQPGAAGLREPAEYRSGKEQKLKNAQQIADNI